MDAVINSQLMISSPQPALPKCRLYLEDEPHDGFWNMAVDEALLEAAVRRQECSLRWYSWSEATLSLGYFQPDSLLANSPELNGLPRVRRLSGGGAILHHHEWTYSCAVPSRHGLAREPQKLYSAIHERVITVLRRFGVDSHLRGETCASARDEFLCFARGDASDILCAGHKIMGSAQRRRRGAVLQHGSLLLRRSKFAPRFPGIDELNPQLAFHENLRAKLAESMGSLLGR